MIGQVIRVTCDRITIDLRGCDPHTPFGIKWGPRITTMAERCDTLVTDLWLTSDTLRPISDRPTTWARPPRVTCLTGQKFAWDKYFKSDLRPIYDHAKWHTRPPSDLRPTCKDLWPKEDPAASWVTHKWNWQVPQPFLMVESNHRACRIQWRVSPSHCKEHKMVRKKKWQFMLCTKIITQSSNNDIVHINQR